MANGINDRVLEIDDQVTLDKAHDAVDKLSEEIALECQTMLAVENVVEAIEAMKQDQRTQPGEKEEGILGKISSTVAHGIGAILGSFGLESYDSVMDAAVAKGKQVYETLAKLVAAAARAMVNLFVDNVNVIEHSAKTLLKTANAVNAGQYELSPTVNTDDIPSMYFTGIMGTDVFNEFMSDVRRIDGEFLKAIRESSQDVMRGAVSMHQLGASKELAIDILNKNIAYNLRGAFSLSNTRSIENFTGKLTPMFVGGSMIEMNTVDGKTTFTYHRATKEAVSTVLKVPNVSQVMQIASAMQNKVKPSINNYANTVKNVGKNIEAMIDNLQKRDADNKEKARDSRALVQLYTDTLLRLTSSLVRTYRISCLATTAIVQKAIIKK